VTDKTLNATRTWLAGSLNVDHARQYDRRQLHDQNVNHWTKLMIRKREELISVFRDGPANNTVGKIVGVSVLQGMPRQEGVVPKTGFEFWDELTRTVQTIRGSSIVTTANVSFGGRDIYEPPGSHLETDHGAHSDPAVVRTWIPATTCRAGSSSQAAARSQGAAGR
jgi:hypothetical protein